MYDSIHPAPHYTSSVATHANVPVTLPRADSCDSIFPYKGIEQEALISWLIVPRTSNSDTSVYETENTTPHIPEPFYPQLARRSYAEKQYNPLPIQDIWSTYAGSLSFTFAFLLVGILLSAYIRFRFWKYYTEYAKLLFHPRSLVRVNEVEGPHIAQFHFIVDLTNIFSISVIALRGLELFSLEQYTEFLPKPCSASFKLSNQSARYLACYLASVLLYRSSALAILPSSRAPSNVQHGFACSHFYLHGACAHSR